MKSVGKKDDSQSPNTFLAFAKRDLSATEYVRAVEDFPWYFRYALREVEPPFRLWLYSASYNLRQQLYRVLEYLQERRLPYPPDLDSFLVLFERVYADWKRDHVPVRADQSSDAVGGPSVAAPVLDNLPLRDPLRFPANSNLYKSNATIANAISLIKTHADKAKILKRVEWNRARVAKRSVDRLFKLLYLQEQFAKSASLQ